MISTRYDASYKKWLTELKQKIRAVQLKAAIAVNSEMLQFYWELGVEFRAYSAVVSVLQY